MHTGDRVPRIAANARMAEAIVEMTSKGFGCVAVFEDRPARRHHHRRRSAPSPKPDFSLDTPAVAVMTRRPRTIAPDALVAEALEQISHKIQALLVVDHDRWSAS